MFVVLGIHFLYYIFGFFKLTESIFSFILGKLDGQVEPDMGSSGKEKDLSCHLVAMPSYCNMR